MEKKIIIKTIDYELSWIYGVSIERIREDLKAVEELGATHIEIEAFENYGEIDLSVESYVKRLETDEEFNKRLNKEKDLLKQLQERELQEYKRLKSKYDN